jgi:hypothetical protein
MMSAFDPFSQDPPYDHANPPRNVPVQIPSAGVLLNGVYMTAQGAGAHPTIVLLHGFPGNERNFDLAQILRRAGWNVLIFHYRGAWGSPGMFSFANVLEDTHAAVAYLRTMRNVDVNRIVLMGHSMGAWAALHGAAADTGVFGAAALATWNPGAYVSQLTPDQYDGVLQWFTESCAPLRPDSPRALFDEMLANAAQWDLRQHAFSGRHVLLVAGADDDDTPDVIHHNPLVKAYADAKLTHCAIENADHGFSGQRVALARAIINWLNTLS